MPRYAAPPAADAWLEDPTGPLPASLTRLGLHPDPGDRSTVAVGVHAFTPRWPLWTNGSEKRRFIRLPDGASVDTRQWWSFPPGTVFFKTFLYPEADGDGCLVPVETRVMRARPDGWDFAAYAWNEHGTEATLLGLEDRVTVTVTTEAGTLEHTIPAELDCETCHASAPGAVLGFRELQLAHEVDGELQLDAFTRGGMLSPPPPSPPETIPDADPLTRDVLGYFEGNCVHCHNGGDGPSASFDLRHDVALDNVVNRPTEDSATAAGIRVVPGDPEASVLFLGLIRDDVDVDPMPPLGVDVRDDATIATLRRFIEELDG